MILGHAICIITLTAIVFFSIGNKYADSFYKKKYYELHEDWMRLANEYKDWIKNN